MCPFTDYISKISNSQVDNAKDIDVGMPVYNLIEYSDNYSKIFGNLWQDCRDKPAVNNNGNVVDFNADNVTDSFNFNKKITGQRDDSDTKNVEIMIPLKCSTILTGKNLCFTEFSTDIHSNTRLAASNVFHILTQSIKFF